MEKEQPKKCFCARCFLPIEDEDKVDIDGQNFHRMCSMCCVCRMIPQTVKMFYGHVFCNDCFKAHVLERFKGDAPRMHSSSWWTQWAPGANPRPQPNEKSEKEESKAPQKPTEESFKKCICSRCLQTVDENEKVDVDGQHFHPQCAKCYFCQTIPTKNLKIYYGQVFCEECFHRHVLNRNRDNPSEFFKTCFEQWQNVQFAEGMRQFMGCNDNNKEGGTAPFIHCHCAGKNDWGPHPDTRKCHNYRETINTSEFCKNCFEQLQNVQFAEAMKQFMGINKKRANTPFIFSHCAGQREWQAQPDTRKSGKVTIPEGESVDDLSFENRTDMTDIPEFQDAPVIPAAEKIEKLTKYLHDKSSQVKSGKKWKNFVEPDKISLTSFGWVDLQDDKVSSLDCPKCLWQCGGPIYVPSEFLQGKVHCDLK